MWKKSGLMSPGELYNGQCAAVEEKEPCGSVRHATPSCQTTWTGEGGVKDS